MSLIAAALVDAVLERETAKEFLRRHKVGVAGHDLDYNRDYHIGFFVSTSDEDVIVDVALGAELKLGDAEWRQLNEDFPRLERNLMRLLERNGVHVRDEGHDGNGDLIGSAWVRPGANGWKVVKDYFETDGASLMGTSTMEQRMEHPGTIWEGISQLGRLLLDANIGFFGAKEIERYFDT